MAGRLSGLGRGLDDLLDDNTPDLRADKGSVTLKKDNEPIRITPPGSIQKTSKSLYETKHKNRSVKANFVK